MCVPNLELQLVNPTTQVALFSTCFDPCIALINITWNIYQGFINGSNAPVQWTKFNDTDLYKNVWFFGGFPFRRMLTSIEEYFRHEHDKLHRNEWVVPQQSTGCPMAIRSCLLIRQRDQFKCTQLHHQSTSSERLLLDLSYDGDDEHPIQSVVSGLVRHRWHERLLAIQ